MAMLNNQRVLGIIIPTGEVHIFQRGRSTTNQVELEVSGDPFFAIPQKFSGGISSPGSW